LGRRYALRAERRLGEMMAEQPKGRGRERGRASRKYCGAEIPRTIERPITYDQVGIDKNLTKRARKLAERKCSRHSDEKSLIAGGSLAQCLFARFAHIGEMTFHATLYSAAP
jgi:hypothetical protein